MICIGQYNKRTSDGIGLLIVSIMCKNAIRHVDKIARQSEINWMSYIGTASNTGKNKETRIAVCMKIKNSLTFEDALIYVKTEPCDLVLKVKKYNWHKPNIPKTVAQTANNNDIKHGLKEFPYGVARGSHGFVQLYWGAVIIACFLCFFNIEAKSSIIVGLAKY